MPRIGGNRVNPVNLTGFIPLVDLQGDPQFFPFGATVDERHRSMRARNWWQWVRERLDVIRGVSKAQLARLRLLIRISLGLPSNHPSKAWKRTVPRPPPVRSGYDEYGDDEHGPAWSNYFRERPGAWGRNFGHYSDGQRY